jgi:iron(III) transport system substrate-binding protein
VDIVVGGARTYTDTLLPAKALDPIKPMLFHPEVVDESLWKGGIHRYGDPEKRYVFIFASRNAPIGININTKLVRPGEIKSFWNLFDPKWKGKIVAIQPRVGGITWGWIYYHKGLGPEFLSRIYSEGVLSFVATGREFADGLAVGAYAIGFLQGTGATDLLQLQQRGMPIKLFTAHDLPDLGVGRAGPGGSGMIGVVNRPPHPNAQKLFVNWLLTREAQLYFNKELPDGSPPEYESLRLDVPNDRVVPEYRLTPNFYIPEADPDFVEKENTAVKFVHQVLDKLGR